MTLSRTSVDLACRIIVFAALALAPSTAEAQNTASLVTIADRQVVSFAKQFAPGENVVSFGDRRLYHVVGRGKAASYPIAVPRSQSRWSGVERVSMKRVDPSWTPTPEMRHENPRLPSFVPGGHPMNPLGVRALYLGQTAYRIHGTDAPWTIGADVSKGCIRMLNEHMIELYDRSPIGTKVTATWNRFGAPQMSRAQDAEPVLDLFRF